MILPAVSIRQPWPHAIFHFGKDTENRSWLLPEKFWGRTILLHTGKELDEPGYHWLLEAGYPLPPAKDLQKGGIIGAVIFSGMRPTTSV